MGKNNFLLLLVAFLFVLIGTMLALYLQEPPAAQQTPPAPIPPGCGPLRIYIINVSQADAILIITPGNKTILVDSGSALKKNSVSNLVAFLNRTGVRKIDYLIATHYHEDHIGGMPDVFSRFDVGAVYHNGNCGNYQSKIQEEFEALAAAHSGIAVRGDMQLPSDGCLSDARLVVAYDRPEGCWPSAKASSEENENSILLHLAYGNTSFLFAGDCEAGCESELLAQKTDIRSTFLKAGHHGSDTSSTDQFLTAVSAKYYALSVDMNRSVTDGYYHPRQASLERIYNQSGASVLRTDLNGDISITSDGSAMTLLPAKTVSACDVLSGYASSAVSSYGPIPEIADLCH